MDLLPVRDDDEKQLAIRVKERLDLIEWVVGSAERVARGKAQARSQLSADDRATGWMRTSHQVGTYFQTATDNAQALLRLVRHGNEIQLPIQAHYPLIRTLIEASSLIKWILEPTAHQERVRRSLAARITDLQQDMKLREQRCAAVIAFDPALESEVKRAGEAQQLQSERDRNFVRGLAEAQDIPWQSVANGAPSMIRMLSESGGDDPSRGLFVGSVWKVLSGLSHPSASRAIHNSHIEELQESADGIVSVRVSASMDITFQGLLVAQGIYLEAVELTRARKLTPHGP